jgi:hypothetical protein
MGNGFNSLISSAMRPFSAAYFTNARDNAGISFQNLQPLDQTLGYLEVQATAIRANGYGVTQQLPPLVYGTYGGPISSSIPI